MFSDEEIKKIKRDYRRLKSYKKCAEQNNISVYMAKKLIKGGANEKNKKRVKMKSVCENAGLQGDAEDYMEKRRRDALQFIGKCLDTMSSEDKLANAPINQIASAMGVVMDKFAKKDDDDGKLGEILKAVNRLE